MDGRCCIREGLDSKAPHGGYKVVVLSVNSEEGKVETQDKRRLMLNGLCACCQLERMQGIRLAELKLLLSWHLKGTVCGSHQMFLKNKNVHYLFFTMLSFKGTWLV